MVSGQVPPNLLPADIVSLADAVSLTIRNLTYSELGQNLKELMKQAVQRSKEKKEVALQVFSGEADPRIWNACSEELLEAVGNGVTCEHLVGPVICTEKGDNAVLNAFQKYPERVHLRLFATRYPYHWVRLTWREGTDLMFDLRGEAYHVPLSGHRFAYEIALKSKKDEEKASKLLAWYSREQNFRESLPITTEAKSREDLTILDLDKFQGVLADLPYDAARGGIHPYDLLTREEIRTRAGM
jgi:hypothetical protein